VRGEVGELAGRYADREIKGEVVLLVGPREEPVQLLIDEESVRERLAEAITSGATRRDAVRDVAQEMGLPKNDVYRLSLGL